jgi:Protein of unknown function (DUF3892)
MADIRIANIRKPNRDSAHEHITHVGNIRTANWIETREAVIKYIENKTHTFHILENGRRSEVSVVYPNDNRSPFLRSHADGYWNDNLLSLPPC